MNYHGVQFSRLAGLGNGKPPRRDAGRALQLQAGQQNVRFELLPGEEVRTPRIAMLMWDGGDWLRAQNLWRKWMIEENPSPMADVQPCRFSTMPRFRSLYREFRGYRV